MIIKCTDANVDDKIAIAIINAMYKLRCRTGINLFFTRTKVTLDTIVHAATENLFKAAGKSLDIDIEGCNIEPK